jgi:surface antigen
MRYTLSAIVMLALAGCVGAGPQETGGTAIGAATGAVIGSRSGGGGTSLGLLLGGIVGSNVGRSMDRADAVAMQQTTQRSLDTASPGQAQPWRNPNNGDYGSVTPTRTFTTAQGSYCREYQQTVTVGNETQQAVGTACRQGDGSWRIVS